MFTAWVIDSAGDTVKQFDDCMNISVYTENQMQEHFPEIIDAIGFCSDYIDIIQYRRQDLDSCHQGFQDAI